MIAVTAELRVARGYASAAGPPMQEYAWPQMDTTAIRRHAGAVRVLCDELDRPQEEVISVYQRELRRLLEYATVVDYLPVLVSKRVRQLYRRRLQAGDEGDPCAEPLAWP